MSNSPRSHRPTVLYVTCNSSAICFLVNITVVRSNMMVCCVSFIFLSFVSWWCYHNGVPHHSGTFYHSGTYHNGTLYHGGAITMVHIHHDDTYHNGTMYHCDAITMVYMK